MSEKLEFIKDSNGNTSICNDSVIQINHYHNERDINFDLEATKAYNFLREKCSKKLFSAITTKFAEELE